MTARAEARTGPEPETHVRRSKKSLTLCGQCAGWVLTLTVIVGCFNTYQHSTFTWYQCFELKSALKKPPPRGITSNFKARGGVEKEHCRQTETLDGFKQAEVTLDASLEPLCPSPRASNPRP